MNKYPSINDLAFQEQVKKWIELDGEIYVNVGFWRAGGADFHILCKSYDAFLDVLLPLKERKGAVTVLRNPEFKVSGIASKALLEQSMIAYPEGTDWFLICPDYKSPYNSFGSGDRTHNEMQELFQRLDGRFIVVGDDKDFPPGEDRDDVLVARFNL